MKKLCKNQILFHKSSGNVAIVTFYEVLRATTRTCEVQEIHKRVIRQDTNEQFVIPLPGNPIGNAIRRPVSPTGAVAIEGMKFAWPWDGQPVEQDTIIFI